MDFFGILFDIKNGSKMPYSKNYFDTLFAAKLEELGVKTITGTLPLTFTAKAGAADTWTIYGNDDNGTENMFDKTQTITEGSYLLPSGNINTESIWGISDYIPVQPNTTYTLCKCMGNTPSYVWYDSAKTYISGTSYSNRVTNTETSPANAAYLRVSLRIDDRSNVDTFMLVKGSTAPDHYIPWQKGVGEQRVDGYYVPLTISQQGQTDKTVDIFIGDSPLTEGETVSKASTGVDIELFAGENTVSTTLYNKPTMTITYK